MTSLWLQDPKQQYKTTTGSKTPIYCSDLSSFRPKFTKLEYSEAVMTYSCAY
jgi:hypothetical protein